MTAHQSSRKQVFRVQFVRFSNALERHCEAVEGMARPADKHHRGTDM